MMVSAYLLFNIKKYLLSAYSSPGIVLGSRDMAISKTKPLPSESHILVRKACKKQIKLYKCDEDLLV